MRPLLIFLALQAPILGAMSSVQVVGVTPTQAILAYTSPDSGACTLAVSTSASLTPVVYDVDESRFPGSSLDSRPGNAGAGRPGAGRSLSGAQERVFVLGKRQADIAADGKRYSRALQANTLYYFQVTCGSDTATGTFTTANIPLGKTYGELPPVDRAHPGQYSWPAFDDTPREKRPGYVSTESEIDPVTGIRAYRLTLPGDNPAGTYKANFSSNSACRQSDGGADWSNAANACANAGGQYASTSAAGKWLLLRQNSINLGGATPDAMTVSLAGYGSAGNPADRTVEICVTNDGMTCATATQTVVLNEGSEQAVTVPAAYTSFNTDWPSLNSMEPANGFVSTASGTVNATDDAAGSTVTWEGGGVNFPETLAPGSGILIGGVEHAIAAVNNVRTSLKLADDVGKLTNAPYSAPVFGFLLRKTTGTGTVYVRNVAYSLYDSLGNSWPAGGGGSLCSQNTIQDGAGIVGRYCFVVFPGNTSYLYWISEAGEARWISPLILYGDPPYWGSQNGCAPLWDSSDPTAFYCAIGERQNVTLVKVAINYPSIAPRAGRGSGSQYLPNCGSAPCWNITVLGTNVNASTDPASLMHAFDPNSAPFSTCGLAGSGPHSLLIQCLASVQDTIGWLAVWDLTKNAAQQNPIVAATDSFASQPHRWCTVHAASILMGSANLAMVAPQQGGGGAEGAGPWVSRYVSGNLTKTLDGCPPNAVEPGVAGQPLCSTVVVDGEPCDPTPVGSEAHNCRTPGRAGDHYLQDAQPGDVMNISDAAGNSENVRLIARSGTAWALERGYYGTPVRDWSASTGISFSMLCEGWYLAPHQWSTPNWWWDFAADPHGGASIMDPMASNHGSQAKTMDVGDAGAGPNDCPGIDTTGLGLCYNVRTGLNTLSDLAKGYGVSGTQKFAGQWGEGYPNATESHIHTLTGSPTWIDARPYFSSASPIGSEQINFTNLAGSLYKASQANDGSSPIPFTANRKLLPTLASCGRFPMVDVSGPASTLTGNAGDAYKYCVALHAGECSTGSNPGDVFVNCPGTTVTHCSGSNADFDICVMSGGSNSGVISQYWFSGGPDASGTYQRVLTSGFQGYRQFGFFWNAKYTSAQSNWLLAPVTGELIPGRTDALMFSLPPVPPADSIARNDFIPVTVQLAPPRGMNPDNAVVEFGYAENGDASSYYCTSRQETCVAVSGSVNDANPFYYASENFQGMSCGSGCTITVPGLPGRILYYRWKFRDAQNNVLATGAMQVKALP